uniref:ArdC family protein n=1 Tax=Amycolatopsis sp. CA-290885 TaxID=3239925 RepID=UPI003F49B120
MGKRDERRQEREAADGGIRERAAELLADPERAVAMVRQLIEANSSPRVLRYSLRNQAMLSSQAEERGMSLIDVDTFKGWLNRGRVVRRGEHGLRIVRPRGRAAESAAGGQREEKTEKAAPEQGSDQGKQQGEESGERVSFRMMTVFDISQTEAAEDVEIVGEAEQAEAPVQLLRETLRDQLARFGCEITEAPAATVASVEDDRVVTVPPGQPVEELARALAIVVTAAKKSRTPSAT